MAQTQLTANSTCLRTHVTFCTGERGELTIAPNEFFYDENGYVRVFSKVFDSGTVCNLKLLPNNLSVDVALRFTRSFLVPFGLQMAGALIFSGNSMVENVAQELFSMGAELFINDIFAQYSIANSSYYDMISGEVIITHPIRVMVR